MSGFFDARALGLRGRRDEVGPEAGSSGTWGRIKWDLRHPQVGPHLHPRHGCL